MLIEKRSYGRGVTDAGQLTEVRHYRDKPANQYFDPQGPANDEDDIGWVTLYHHDWRMRQVRVEEHDSSGNPVANTVTWYDNLDRPCLVAEYGRVVPEVADPRGLPAHRSSPSTADIAAILGQSVKPRSLVETRYNLKGQVEQVRRYQDVQDSQPTCTVSTTYYDHADHPVELHTPGAGVQKYDYDAKGRQIRSRTLAGTAELTRTETLYNALDQAWQNTRWERVHNASGDGLDESNSVRTWTHTWFDPAGKVTATADYGANTGDNTFTGGTVPSGYAEGPEASRAGGARVTTYGYDGAGNQATLHHPNGTVTLNEYDGLGRLILVTEDADKLARQTAYRYECSSDATSGCTGSRLIAVAAVLPAHQDGRVTQWRDINWHAADGTLQITGFEYGAEVVNSGGESISRNNSWISEVHYPDPQTGQPSVTADLTFRYYSDGSVAFRGDRKGNAFWYQYDELGRLGRVDVTTASSYVDGIPLYTPPVPIHHVAYQHDDLTGKLSLVTAFGDAGGSVVISQDKLEYDVWGNLLREWQAHGASVTSGSPLVEYEWESRGTTAGASAVDRLRKTTYPRRPETISAPGRTLELVYGGPGTADDALDRVTQVSEGAPWADFGYAGISRRISARLGNLLNQSFGQVGGYPGLDRFGQVRDLWFTQEKITTPADHTLFRYQYAHDAAGNRQYAKLTSGASGCVGERSYYYRYDGLGRLIEAQRDPLLSGPEEIPVHSSVALSYTLWELDILGNWSADDGLYAGRVELSSTFDVQTEVVHQVDSSNRITHVVQNGVSQEYVHDLNGNLVFDGAYVYQYDAWNRLVEVNDRGTLTAGDFTADGRLPSIQSHALGDLLMQMVYDGVGRLIEVRRPDASAAPPRPLMDVEAYYYDGVRRIQARTATETAPGVTGSWHTEREFIYGPGYVDEFIAQIDDPAAAQPTVMYLVQDANYNVAAVLGAPADPETQPPTILAEYTYDPYGEPAYASEPGLGAGSWNTLGHQGLFFYSFAPSGSPFAVGTPGLYYNRNRWYSPRLGRFLQQDPNATGALTTPGDAYEGIALDPSTSPFEPSLLFRNGLHLYQYLQGQPLLRTDPSGLFSYIEIMGVSAFGADMDASRADVGMSLLGAIRGMTDLINHRSFILASVADMAAAPIDTRGMDMALAMYSSYQIVQNVALGMGVLKAGYAFATKGVQGLARLANRKGHHTIPRWAGGNKDQLIYAMMWRGRGSHIELETLIDKRMRARFRIGTRGRGGGEGAWKRAFSLDESLQEQVFEELMDIYQSWDRTHGTRLTGTFIDNLLNGLFAPR